MNDSNQKFVMKVIASMDSVIKELKVKIDTLNNGVITEKNKSEEYEMRFNLELTDKDIEIEKLKKEIEKLKKEKEKLREKNKSLSDTVLPEKEKEHLSELFDTQNRQIVSLENDQIQLLTSIKEHERNTLKFKDEKQTLESEKQTLKSEKQKLESEKQTLEYEKQKLEIKLESEKQKLEIKLESEKQKLETEKQKLESEKKKIKLKAKKKIQKLKGILDKQKKNQSKNYNGGGPIKDYNEFLHHYNLLLS